MVKVSKMDQEQILKLHSQGKSSRAIAKMLKVGRNTVRAVIERGEIVATGSGEPKWSKAVNWERIHLEISRGVQFNILYKEHASALISYTQFWREYHRRYPAMNKITMRLEHRAGEKCFFDYCEGIDIINPSTGEITKTSLLCGVMAMSSKTFGEFTLSQKRDDLIRAMENIFRQFGGVTPYVTVDNQKAAINHAHWYDPDINPEFVDFANHWGFAVLPARPMRPQDKGANESGIGVIQRQFYQEVRDKKFYSLHELNMEFRKYLDRLNKSIMKDWGVSRDVRFEGERKLLKPCPTNNWEKSEWRVAKVHADCHVQAQKSFYSVPYHYVGQSVRVRLKAKLVEIFDEDLNPLATHCKVNPGERATDTAHYPEEKLAVHQFSVQVAKRDAERVGPKTIELVNHLLDISHPLKYLRRVQGILRLAQKYNRESMEHACEKAMLFKKPYYSYVKSTAEYVQKNGVRPKVVSSAPQRDQSSMYLHQSQP